MQFIKLLWGRWKKIAHHIGIFQSRVLLTVFYFTLLLPIGIIFTFTKDKLGIKTATPSTWVPKNKHQKTLEDVRKQF